MTEWLSVPECAQALGVRDSRVRELLRERVLIATRRGPNNALAIPADFLLTDVPKPHVLPTLRGTATVLADLGLDDDAIVAWLLEDNAELGSTPVAALREGRRAPVRRVAQTLL